ncbi:MgtC/SapB family protein [Azospirillum sp. 11R-A]|uniref:MgtC/SapB family protein n=1 Tax=Azospirillum sp. 11R-A TaxID=3111634 RepID=UPI003C284835
MRYQIAHIFTHRDGYVNKNITGAFCIKHIYIQTQASRCAYGFLGAGVIMREGLSIRGLSTAASIWATSAIGIVIGLGFYAVAIAAALLTILVMSLLRPVERLLPHQSVVHLTLVFPRDKAPPPEELRAQAKKHGFEVVDWAFHLANGSGQFECQLVLQGRGDPDPMALVSALASTDTVVEFKLSPSRI